MNITDIANDLQGSNPEAAQALTAYQDNFNNTLGKVTALEKDLRSSVEKRDSLKTIIRNTTGLEEITEDALKGVLSGKGDNEVYLKEIDALKLKLGDSANAVDAVSTEYEKTIFGLKLDRSVSMLGANDEVHSPHAYSAILGELGNGAVFNDNGEIVYKNEDGTSVFAQDGKELGIKAKYELMKADEKFSYLFKDQFQSGGGKAPSGPAQGSGGETLHRSKMADGDKAAYIAKHSMQAYRALPL